MERLAFEGVLVAGGPGRRWTCVKVPVFVPAVFGGRSGIPVRGTVNGRPFRAAIHAGGDGGFFVVVPRAACAAAGVRAGDRVAVTLEPGGAATPAAPGPAAPN
jgi:hypothetical protein